MTEFGQLLELLYSAHRGVDAMFVEIRDLDRREASDVLIVQKDDEGGTRLRFTGGGLYGQPLVTTRRLWFAPPDRVRVEVLRANRVIRAAVRDGDAWWRWDLEDGESAGDLAKGGTLPALLDPALLTPAWLLSTTWLEVTGTGRRAGRPVITANGTPRQKLNGAERRLGFEFDAEHGTPLHVATFDAGERTNVTEVLSIDYTTSLDPAIFSFERLENTDSQRSAASPARPRRRLAQASPSSPPVPVPPRPVLADHKTIWLTGLSGAGKTTIARTTERLLHQLGAHCCVLDGDQLRTGLSSDLGLSRVDRGEQARRAAHIATILADSGVVPIVALVSPYAEDRQRAKEIHEAAGVGFLEVWVDTPLEICSARDPKGLYAAARSLSTVPAPPTPDGSGLTGLTAPYEEPAGPDLRVSGDQPHPRVAAIAIVEKLLSKPAQTRVLRHE